MADTLPIIDTMRIHPESELTVIRKWASGMTHLAWVGGWPHSVDMTEVLGATVIVARPPLPALCGAVIRGPWPFSQAGDLVICMEDGKVTCRRCRSEAGYVNPVGDDPGGIVR